jgi:hypothetical protein
VIATRAPASLCIVRHHGRYCFDIAVQQAHFGATQNKFLRFRFLFLRFCPCRPSETAPTDPRLKNYNDTNIHDSKKCLKQQEGRDRSCSAFSFFTTQVHTFSDIFRPLPNLLSRIGRYISSESGWGVVSHAVTFSMSKRA